MISGEQAEEGKTPEDLGDEEDGRLERCLSWALQIANLSGRLSWK